MKHTDDVIVSVKRRKRIWLAGFRCREIISIFIWRWLRLAIMAPISPSHNTRIRTRLSPHGIPEWKKLRKNIWATAIIIVQSRIITSRLSSNRSKNRYSRRSIGTLLVYLLFRLRKSFRCCSTARMISLLILPDFTSCRRAS